MSAPTDGLAHAVSFCERDAQAAIDRLRQEDLLSDAEYWALQKVVALAGCLRRLLPERTVVELHNAFGAPGDFGYDTAVGDALYRLYRGDAK